MRLRKIHRGTATALLLLTLVAACSSDSSPATTAATAAPSSATPVAPTGPSASYVALGDSFTAGPGILPEQDGAGFCRRSAKDWPTVAAAALGRDVTDVSCAGATTADLAATVRAGVVGPETSLVTVSAGGNDGGLFLSLLRSCSGPAATCDQFTQEQVPTTLRQTTTDLTALLKDVRTAAPSATVLLVGYPRILPSTGTCTVLGISTADATAVMGAEEALDTALADAAEGAGVPYVSPRAPSEGHDACAGAQAWTNGIAPAAGDGIVFHPNARGMAAVGALVAAAAG